MQWLLLFLQGVVAVLLYLVWQWVRALPAAIHKRQEQLFQQQLSKELELLKISQSQIQVRKLERFIDFAKLQQEILTNDEFKEKVTANDPNATARLRELAVELGIGLFFFASDETVRAYGRWKRKTAVEGANPIDVLVGVGDLMVALRQDIGYTDTTLSGDDYLRMFVTDWDDVKQQTNQ